MARIQHNGSGERAPGRPAFTLLEIMVALVVLLIGILAVLRLFPGGFLTIEWTGEMARAQALAQQQMADVRNMPYGIEEITAGVPDNNGIIHEISSIRPDDLTDASTAELQQIAAAGNFTLDPLFGPYYFSNANRVKFIKGETFTVPEPVTVPLPAGGAVYGSVYTLQFGPVYNKFHTNPDGSPADSLSVYGAPMTGSAQSSVASAINNNNPIPVVDNDTQYAIDYQNHMIAFFPRVQDPGYAVPYRLFNFKFVYPQPSPAGPETTATYWIQIKVPDVPPPAQPQALQPVWQNIFDPNLSTLISPSLPGGITDPNMPTNIAPAAEVVNRAFRLITTSSGVSPAFSKDPYEYAWYSVQDPGHPNLGTLIFNPLGHVSYLNANNTSAAGESFINQQSLVASVDYLAFDNHILRDDRSMPPSAPYRITLSAPNVWSHGDTLPSQFTYDGIFTDPTANQGNIADNGDLLVVDMRTGELLSIVIAGASVPTSPLAATLNATTGTLYFPATANGRGVEDLGLQRSALRIYYRAQNDWGMQVQKAAGHYYPVSNPALLTSNTFYVGGSDTGGDGIPTRIYFTPSEAGKTIDIGTLWYANANSSPQQPQSYVNVTDQTFQINDNPAFFTNINGQIYTWIDIAPAFPDAQSISAVPTGRAVDSVQGASLLSRVVWQNTPGSWRKVDEQTVLQSNQAP